MIREQLITEAKKHLGTAYSKMDCSLLVQTTVAPFGYKLPRSSTEQALDMNRKGLLRTYSPSVTVAQILPTLQKGDLIFWQQTDTKKGAPYCGNSRCDGGKCRRWNRIHHVAMYDQDGYNYESAGAGVQRRKVWETSSWQIVMSADVTSLLNYENKEEEEVIQRGQKNENVREWQKALMLINPAALPKFGADSDFGAETETWTKNFQSSVKLPQTGKVDDETQAAMFKALSARATDTTELKALQDKLNRYDTWAAGVKTAANMKI